jgi:regulator of protease activity HflC (stomatin/prohibitin superfamily)
VAEAVQEARAKLVFAEGEKTASFILKSAISNSPTALQLKYLQTLKQIATDKNSTIIFPVSEFIKINLLILLF